MPHWGEECITSINNIELSDLWIYPNPTEAKLSIAVNSEIINEINIYNQFNQRILNTTTLNGELDVSKLKDGLYIIETIINKKRFRQKIIKK